MALHVFYMAFKCILNCVPTSYQYSNSLPDKNFVQVLQELYNGGPDFTFECVGNVHVMRIALESAHKGFLLFFIFYLLSRLFMACLAL